jgi:PAT family beta-lactamase induction signal transducer AmpG
VTPPGKSNDPPAEAGPTWFYPSVAALLYFSEGLPYGIVNELMPLYLRLHDVSLEQIGLLSTVGLAWTWKVLWSPLVDRYGTYRRWVAGSLVAIVLALAALTTVDPRQTTILWTLIAILAFASATQDMAADALMIRITPERMLGPVNSVRVAAYRGAVIVAGGGLAALATPFGWRFAFAAAAILAAGILVATKFLPREDRSAAGGGGAPMNGARRESIFAGLSEWISRPHAVAIIAFILLYKLGDFALAPMIKPYWVDRGFSAAEIGTVTTVMGVSFLIAGAIAGGAAVARFGIYSCLLWFGILQMLSNLGYALIGSFGGNRPALYAATIIENFTWGLATAAFLAFLMSICDREHAATQYAMLSALFGLSRSLIGTASGFSTAALGYSGYFWVTVALGVPGLLFIPLIRSDRGAARASTAQVLES